MVLMNNGYILPKPLYTLTIMTLVLSIALFVISMLDLGTVSFWLNVAASLIIILHDATLIHLARRARANDHRTPDFFPPAASLANILVLGICAFVLLAGFAMTVFSAVFASDGEISWGTPTNMGTIIAQAAIAPVTAILLLANAGWCIRSRKVGSAAGYGAF
ncbi:hypothetical protein EW146_g5938 [Bondarzewia mesenterica]|uniref:Uncharacterized protein n=1 Tax=Bondarzewia mesenterica TaxID=1095465 RepID=A0A4S4LS16_9AGAM|nr:hypothetical protein EW146_g5938 [Bondarzewia mesenterica]